MIKKRKTKTAVKRAISVPSEVDSEIAALSESEGRSYSSLVQEALKLYMNDREEREMETAYRAHYAEPARRAEAGALAADLFHLGSGALDEPGDRQNAPDKR